MDTVMLGVTTFWYYTIIMIISFYMMRTPIKRFAGFFWIASVLIYMMPASYLFYDVFAGENGYEGFAILAGLCLAGLCAGTCVYAGFMGISDVVQSGQSQDDRESV